MAAASVSSGTPPGRRRRSRARRSSRKVIRATIATATEPNRSVSAPVRLSATVPVPAAVAQDGGLVADPGDAVFDQLGEEGVEIGEVPVQDALGAARLVVTARLVSALRPVPEQDALGGVEQLLARVAEGHPGRHRPSSFAEAPNTD